jgi:hypothetical protein
MKWAWKGAEVGCCEHATKFSGCMTNVISSCQEGLLSGNIKQYFQIQDINLKAMF